MAAVPNLDADCSVCTEKYNKTIRKQITCSYCSYSACFSCTKTYLLGTVHEAHCMNCRKEWNLDMLNKQFTKSFLTDEYRKMRETVLFEEEKTYLPQLQTEAERLLGIERLTKQLQDIEHQKLLNDQKEDQLVSTQRLVNRQLQTEANSIYNKRSELYNTTHRVSKERKEFIMKCPMEDCRGFLSNRYKCGLCDSTICKECHKRKEEEEHVCNPDDVATITELNNTTKPCPKCHCRIYKTDGCDQMFCIQCHTAFSWRTGEIESGIIHNPHYFEALRAGNIIDIRHRALQGGCGPMPAFYIVRTFMRSSPPNIQSQLTQLYQNLTHHRQVTMPALAHRENRDKDRIQYLMGHLDEKKFKQRVYVYQQTTLRKREEQQIMDSYVTIGEELFRALDGENAQQILPQLLTLRQVTYDAICHIDKKYVHKGSVNPVHIINA
jgi:hypothetical protein